MLRTRADDGASRRATTSDAVNTATIVDPRRSALRIASRSDVCSAHVTLAPRTATLSRPLRLKRSIAIAIVVSAAGCAGAGEGSVTGTTNVPICRLNGAYDLHASFYGANREGSLLWIRIQNGGGPSEYADGLWITIDDTDAVAAAIAASSERDADGNPVATLPVGQRGTPGVLVHATISLDWSCGRRKVTRLGENVGLWAYDGSITFRSIDLGPDVPATTANPDPRVTDVSAFHFRMHDPRAVGPNDVEGVPASTPVGDADINGYFKFRYTRAVPAQFFP